MDNKQFWVAMATAIVTLIGIVYAFEGAVQSATPVRVGVLYDRIDVLETRLEDREGTQRELEREFDALELRFVAASSTSPRQVVYNFLEAITDYPAWCKRYDADRDVFIMWSLNAAYSTFYGVSRSLYLGNTDFFVWGRELGAIYDANDREVLSSRDFNRFIETVNPENEPPTDHLFWKFYVPLYGGVELVCGIQIPPMDYNGDVPRLETP